MTNSSPQAGGMTLPIRLLDELQPERLQRQIIVPLQRAVSTFMPPVRTGTAVRDLLEYCGCFLIHLHRHGLRPPSTLGAVAARGVALHHLRSYASGAGRGYDAALADVLCEPAQGLDAILNHMWYSVLDEERSKYCRSVIARHILPLNWSTRKLLVPSLLADLGNHAPPILRERPVGLLAGELESLVMLRVQVKDGIAEQLGGWPNKLTS